MVSSNFPNRPFRLEEQVDTSSNWDANQTTARGRLWIRKNSYSPSYSFSANSSFSFSLAGQQLAAGTFGYDFRSSDELLLCDVSRTFNHDANGNLSFSIKGSANVDQMGYTEVNSQITMPRIPQVPAAPTPVGIDQITSSSMRYRFSGNSDGGSPIRRWEVQAWGDPSFNGAGTVTSDGTYVAGPVPPGYTIWFRSRGVNDRGAGPWSAVISATTLGTAPTVPQNVSVEITVPDTAKVSWTPPDNSGGRPITGYEVLLSSNANFTADVAYRSVSATTRSVTFQGETALTPGKPFWVAIRALNANAQGQYQYVGPLTIPAGGKTWTGTSWKTALFKAWTGATWKISRVKTWTGSQWKAAK